MADQVTRVADPIAFAEARLDETEHKARQLMRTAQDVHKKLREPKNLGRWAPGWGAWPAVEALCAQMLRDVEAGRRILARHRECWEHGNGVCWEFPGPAGLCRELADLLFRWADHVEYAPAWLPDEEA